MQAAGSLPVSVAGLPMAERRSRPPAAAAAQRCSSAKTAGAKWQQPAQPLPGMHAGALALFREGGALRAIVTGSGTRQVNKSQESQVPPGAPPNLQLPIPTVAGRKAAPYFARPPRGWSDERHEVDLGRPRRANYDFQDLPLRPRIR